jgi:type IV pilus assembly protein PilM
MKALRAIVREVSPRLFRGSALPIGLHVAGERLSAAQMQRTPAGLAVHAVGSMELGCPWYALTGEPRRLNLALSELWAAHGFRGRDVVACMPQEQLKVFNVDYTAAPGQPDSEAVGAEVAERLKGQARRMVVDFVPVRRPNPDERARQAVVAAAAHEDVTTFLGLLEGAGLSVRALDISGMALKRIVPWVARSSGEEMQNVLLLDIGAASSHLMVLWGRRLMLDRGVEFSAQRLVSRAMKVLNVAEPIAKRLLAEHGLTPQAGARPSEFHGAVREVLAPELAVLKDEVSKTLGYASSRTRGNSVDKILLVDSGAGFPGIARCVSDALGRRIELLDPLAIFPHRLGEREVDQFAPRCGAAAVAIGLALRGLDEQ